MRSPQVSVMMFEEVTVRCPGLAATVQVEIVPPVLASLEEIVAENNRSGAIQRSGLSEIGACHILVHERMSQFPTHRLLGWDLLEDSVPVSRAVALLVGF